MSWAIRHKSKQSQTLYFFFNIILISFEISTVQDLHQRQRDKKIRICDKCSAPLHMGTVETLLIKNFYHTHTLLQINSLLPFLSLDICFFIWFYVLFDKILYFKFLFSFSPILVLPLPPEYINILKSSHNIYLPSDILSDPG